MNKREREELKECLDDIRNSDEQAEGLVRLFNVVKRMIGYR